MADLKGMITLLFLFALKVVSAGEMACVGTIQEMKVPEDVYVAGVNGEGISAFGSTGQILFLEGPGVSLLKAGTVQRVIRPEGKVRDPQTNEKLGVYYKDIGRIRIEAVEQGSATARILANCEGMLKGDIVVPSTPKPDLEFGGTLSNDLTQIQGGLMSSILLGKEDARQLAAGQFCFIPVGHRDGVKPGDRFVVFRPQPGFNSQDMDLSRSAPDALYSPARGIYSRYKWNWMLHDRKLPAKVLGDVVIVEAGEGVSTGKIINSMSEIHPGDLVVKK